MLVEDVMKTPVLMIDAETAMADALDKMIEEHVGSLVVTEGSPPRKTGIVTDSDVKNALVDVEHPLEGMTIVQRFLYLLRQPETGVPVSEYMSSPVVTIQPDETLSTAVEKMNDHDIKHLVVTDKLDIVGIVTPSDVSEVHDEIVSEARRSQTQRPHWEN